MTIDSFYRFRNFRQLNGVFGIDSSSCFRKTKEHCVHLYNIRSEMELNYIIQYLILFHFVTFK